MPRDSMSRSVVRLTSISFDLILFLTMASALSWWMVTAFDPAFAELSVPATPPGPVLIALNAAPAVIVSLLLLALTRRGLLAIGISLALLYLLYFANAIKLDLLDTPVLPGDFMLLMHVGGGSGGALLTHYLDFDQLCWAAAVLAALIGLCVFERRWFYLRGLPRLVVLLIALGLGVSIALNLSLVSTLYSEPSGKFLAWSPAVSSKESGLPVTLLNYLWGMSAPSLPIDRAAAGQLIDAHPLPAASPSPDEWPDIIVVQSESFFDPARLRKIGDDQFLPELRRLSQQYRHGELRVPTYGGGTIRTEFEVLTGLAMREFPTVEYPYFWLANSKSVPSLAHTLAAKGYQTLAIHPNTRDFWNRAATFEHMGFEAFDAAEQFKEAARIGYYHSDAELTDHMIKKLDEARQPIFMFAISMENHGPYEDYPNVDPNEVAAQPVPEGLDPLAKARLQGYLLHLANADRALGRLVDTVKKRKRRSVLLFYGDHLPGLPLVYAQLGFDDGAPGPAQPVPWLLIDTAQAPALHDPETTTSFYLPALLLEAAGIDDRGYFTLLDGLRRDDPSGLDQTSAHGEGVGAIMRLQQRGELVINP